MYVIVVGGGKIGYYLTKTLVNEGYEVLLIEKDKKKVETYLDRFGSVVMLGDGCEVSTLELAGAARSDVVIAVTGDDEDNMVICQVAKARFNVPRTVARVNNPKNEQLLRNLGVDETVNQTNLTLNILEQMIPERGLVHLYTLKHAALSIVESRVNAQSALLGKAISEVKFPPGTVISAILRHGQLLIASGSTRFEQGDEVIAIAQKQQEDELQSLFASPPNELLHPPPPPTSPAGGGFFIPIVQAAIITLPAAPRRRRRGR